MAGSEAVARPIVVKPLTSHDDFRTVVDLQRTIWGFADIELLPVRLFVVAGKIGGQLLGAFDGDRMIAFCLAIPGIRPGAMPYLHSHMMGVLQEYRNQGVGRALKLRQREEALARAIELVEWTFDPLEIKNAYFNIERLGAIIRRYVRNQYGISTSRLHGGLPTDRCTAEWWISTERVAAAIGGRAFDRPPVEARISVPANIETIREHEPKRAREIQAEISRLFLEYFDLDLAVTGFERTSDAGTYLLERWA